MSDAQILTIVRMEATDGWRVERVGRLIDVVCVGTGSRFRVRCDGSLAQL